MTKGAARSDICLGHIFVCRTGDFLWGRVSFLLIQKMRGLPCRIGGFTPQRTAFQWENETWGEREGGLQLCKVHFHGRKILSIHRPAV